MSSPKTNHLLTIGIPTYNRRPHLEKQLQSLAKQKGIQDVQILISDNASIDKTDRVVAVFTKKNNNLSITYSKNKTNIGYDRNILTLYEMIKTSYIWFLSDDDDVHENAIANVLSVIKKHKPALIYPNQTKDNSSEPHIKDGTYIDIVNYFPTGKGIKTKTNTLIKFRNETERLAITRISSFISCCIVQKDEKIVPKLQKYVGTGILQDGIMNLITKENPTAFIIPTASVTGGNKESFSHDFIDSTLFGVHKLYHEPELNYSKELVNALALNNAKFALGIMASQSTLGIPVKYSLNTRVLKKLLQTYPLVSLFPFLVAILLTKIVPVSIIKKLYTLIFSLLRKKKQTQYEK